MGENISRATIEIAESAGTKVMILKGDCDFCCCSQINEKFRLAYSPGQRWVLDLIGLVFIDSEVIKSILKIDQVVREGGGKTAILRKEGNNIDKAIRIVGLDTRISTFSDRNCALQEVNKL